jgi:hypothetical protein
MRDDITAIEHEGSLGRTRREREEGREEKIHLHGRSFSSFSRNSSDLQPRDVTHSQDTRQ